MTALVYDAKYVAHEQGMFQLVFNVFNLNFLNFQRNNPITVHDLLVVAAST